MVKQVPSLTELRTEAKIQYAGLTAPRLLPDHIDEMIDKIQYHRFDGTYTIVCCLTLTNKFVVIGSSSPVSPENFNVEICQELAFKDARDKIWKLEEYLLNQQLQFGITPQSFN